MRIIINDIAAEYGGALSVLKNFYAYVRQHGGEHEWIFILSGPYLEPCENIRVVLRPDVKAGRFRKIIFDCVSGRRYIESFHPDVVLSMQNIITFGVKCPQYVYVHQSVPYQNVRKFSLLKKSERSVALIQYAIGAFINRSVKKSDGVFVQTNWMAKAVSEKTGISDKRIGVVPIAAGGLPEIDAPSSERHKNFFYPTNAEIYKNLETLKQAVLILKGRGFTDFHVYLTLPPTCFTEKDVAIQDCVTALGYLDTAQMSYRYRSCTLVFPSYIETVGLPLIEASSVGAPILSADCPYAREALSGYSRARFFSPFDAATLADLMQESAEHGEIHEESSRDPVPNLYQSRRDADGTGWERLIDTITGKDC